VTTGFTVSRNYQTEYVSFDSVQHLALHTMLYFLTTNHQLQHLVHCMLRIFLQQYKTVHREFH